MDHVRREGLSSRSTWWGTRVDMTRHRGRLGFRSPSRRRVRACQILCVTCLRRADGSGPSAESFDELKGTCNLDPRCCRELGRRRRYPWRLDRQQGFVLDCSPRPRRAAVAPFPRRSRRGIRTSRVRSRPRRAPENRRRSGPQTLSLHRRQWPCTPPPSSRAPSGPRVHAFTGQGVGQSDGRPRDPDALTCPLERRRAPMLPVLHLRDRARACPSVFDYGPPLTRAT